MTNDDRDRSRRNFLLMGIGGAAGAAFLTSRQTHASTCGPIPEADIETSCEICLGPSDGGQALVDTLRNLERIRILRGATLTIRLFAGDYFFNRQMTGITRLAGEDNSEANVGLEIRHPDGERIHIIGSGSDSTRLVFTNMHGLLVRDGSSLGLIDAVHLYGDGKIGRLFDPDADKQGILAREGSMIRCGSDVRVSEFSRVGVMAFRNSVIYAASVHSESNGSDGFVSSDGSSLEAANAEAKYNEGVGFFAEWNGTITAKGATAGANIVRAPGTDDEGGGIGFVARQGGVIRAPDGHAVNNEKAGAVATQNSTLIVDAMQFNGNDASHPGIRATYGSHVSCERVTIRRFWWGIHADHGSNIVAHDATLTGIGYKDGVLADHGSSVSCDNISVGSYVDGIVATNASQVFCKGASLNALTRGLVAYLSSAIDARFLNHQSVISLYSPLPNTTGQSANAYIRV
ncbi:MAG: hypothetical protein QNJ97_22650 [Myxococcota bacterium]|nr:hypothetical protein [Myxococcota bacterium]